MKVTLVGSHIINCMVETDDKKSERSNKAWLREKIRLDLRENR